VADQQLLAQRFEEQRGHLRAVTYRMLGSLAEDGKLIAVLGFTIAHGKIVAIDVLADPERLSRLEVAG
jgi:RNA polymerase sigma-70 factor (ECF subfamily)